jgi:RNA polymerase sigma-70 factor (ECF subfamily)
LELLSEGITGWLVRWSEGDEGALEKVTALLYRELHWRAVNYIRREREGHIMQATELVHEAYLQVCKLNRIEWQNRAHFIAMCAQIMRRILLEQARKRQADKRGGPAAQMVPLDPSHLSTEGEVSDVDILALDQALERFTKAHPRQAQVVELRFFGGLTNEEALDVLRLHHPQLSLRTVERDWRFARAWLYGAMGEQGTAEGDSG